MNFLYETGYKKIIIIGLVILVALVGGIFIYMNNQEVEEPVVEALLSTSFVTIAPFSLSLNAKS